MFMGETDYKVIVIDTDHYAGNFEREMCAYITGQYGECGVGKETADRVSSEIKNLSWWQENIAEETDEHQCHRPTSIWPTPGWFNNGMGKSFRDVPEQYEVARQMAVEEHRESLNQSIRIPKDRLERGDFEDPRPGAWTKEACERAIANAKAEMERIEKHELSRHPAYLSVAIFVREFPPQEVIDEIVERANEFSDDLGRATGRGYQVGNSIAVTAFRKLDPANGVDEELSDSGNTLDF